MSSTSLYTLLLELRSSPLLPAGCAIIAAILTFIIVSIKSQDTKNRSYTKSTSEKHCAEEITPLHGFKWHETEPLKLRPFKPKYHLTMAVENISPSELIEMDKNYLSRIQIREKLMEERTEAVLAATDAVKPAVDELYKWLLGTYLPRRFPIMFKTNQSNSKLEQAQFQNLVSSNSYPILSPSSPTEALRILGANLDEDILILLAAEDGDGYTLQGFVNCFPAGFETRQKWLMKLRDIHSPVPGYKEKLEKSMDRYFDKLEVGKFVKRVNWSIATTPDLFLEGEHHLTNSEEISQEAKKIDMTNVFVRCERQTLFRLPQTKALVFTFKTYLYPVTDIKAEGLGEDLANAIDGLKLGSVPGMNIYKRGVVWGDSVKEFLRS